MTDKQIIIDGCDVSGCLFYQTNFEEDYDVKIKHYCSNWHNSCESDNNSNCYYKQLARKEQECEELKKIINEAKSSSLDLQSFLVGEAVQNEYEQQLYQLKSKNDELEK